MATSQLRKFLINRNPRNLEKLCIARRPSGYDFEKNREFRQYYYQLEFQKTHHHTYGMVNHYKDGQILTASTKEFAIASRLHSNTDVAAAYNIGSVLARRCLQTGIHFVHRGLKEDEFEKSERLQAFCRGIQDGGLRLNELPVVEETYEVDAKYFRDMPRIDESKEFEIPPKAS